jgi:hypothetical protein
MSHRNLSSRQTAENVAEFLADREGLAGRARERFLRLLHEYGSFRQVARPRRSRMLILVSLLLALTGFALDHPSGWNDDLMWSGCVLLAAGPIWRFHREERLAPHSDRETDWQAYCLFLRPVILSDHPGLLDHNANNSRPDPAHPMLRPLPMLRNLVHERGSDFWWSTMLGLWGGMMALLITHLTVSATNWMVSLSFPVGGLFLGPVIWILWRRILYLIAKSDARRSDP